jgi:hypothetical protein
MPQFTSMPSARVVKQSSPNGSAVFVVHWYERDERRETGFAEVSSRQWTFYEQSEAEDLVGRLRAAEERDQGRPTDPAPDLEGWDGKDSDDRSHKLPPNPWAERAAEMRKTLPRGVQGTGEIKRSGRIDTHGGDFAASGAIGHDDPFNSAAYPDGSGPSIGSTRDWYRRFGPLRRNISGRVLLRNQKFHSAEYAPTKFDIEQAEARAAKKQTATKQVPGQDFGTFVRRDRRKESDGPIDLDSLPPTTYAFGSRQRIPAGNAPSNLADELALADHLEQVRQANALMAAERRKDRDATLTCGTYGCPNHGPLRRGFCDACRKFKRRNGFLPPPEVIRQRRWRVEAPITN